jgi:poly-gamma-glutamate synthesis protein (capsule biosynthesis protein)
MRSLLRRLAVLVCLIPLILTPLPSAHAEAASTQTREGQVVFSFAGDCTLGSEGKLVGYATSFIQVVAKAGFEWPFSGARPLFASDDLTLVNLEGTFTDSTKGKNKRFVFRAPPSYAEILSLGSVEAVNMANNHSGDFGPEGLKDTREALDARGVVHCGPTLADTTVVTIKGQRILLLGAAYPFSQKRVTEMCEAIAGLRKSNPDIALFVLSVHWGSEMRYKQTSFQKSMAHQLIDAGVDIVVGTHPHVLQGMEMYNGKPIFYSLGNFSFGGNSMPRDVDTAVIQAAYDITDGGLRLSRLEVFPYAMSQNRQGTRQDYRPVPVSGKAAARVLEKLSWQASGFPADFFETGRWIFQATP